MLLRRDFILGLMAAPSALNLAGCAAPVRPDGGAAIAGAIDVHAHVFNGRDIPAAGFVRRVVLRPHASDPVDQDGLLDALAELAISIVREFTPTAEAELAEIAKGSPRLSSAEAARQDQQRLAEALADPRRVYSGRSVAPGGGDVLVDQLYRDAGLDPPSATLALADRTIRMRSARRLAARILDPSRGTPESRAGKFRFGVLRFVTLLTRYRRDILAELVRVHAVGSTIRIFCPALVDYALWYQDEYVTDMVQQVEVMAAVARERRDVLVLNFAAYCPLRAVWASTRKEEPLALLDHALNDKGFAGVKLYPPLGYKPLGNSGENFGHVPHQHMPPVADLGGAIDQELARLYDYCAANEVPILTHANNSLDAGRCTALDASPRLWRKVLSDPRWKSLKVDLAHFGGFEEAVVRERRVRPVARLSCDAGTKPWDEDVAAMTADYGGVYADLSYWTEPTTSERQRVVAATRALVDGPSGKALLQRLLYGSDFSMLAQEPDYGRYPSMVAAALQEAPLSLTSDEVSAIFAGNARRYLMIDHDGPQRARLERYWRDHPVWKALQRRAA